MLAVDENHAHVPFISVEVRNQTFPHFHTYSLDRTHLVDFGREQAVAHGKAHIRDQGEL